ncbi:MAG: hypothetical protein KKD74_11255 [Bacteroidetes bacterium]|nr:hypothetical protein [Bacteroidota bacterium]
MGLKRKIAFCFLLMANVLLLAHLIIPHHHHESSVCVEQAHCANDHLLANSKNFDHHGHHHDGNNGHSYCIVNVFVTAHDNQFRQLSTGSSTLLFNHFTSSPHGTAPEPVLSGIFLWKLTDEPPGKACAHVNSYGLRAPPLA